MSNELNWVSVCDAADLSPLLGVRALLGEQQVAIFKVKETLYAIDAIDPFTKTAVLARGIVGDLKQQIVVASPLYKQHFNLQTGACLEDEEVSIKTFPVREHGGQIQLAEAL
ncbi:nitrite reductase small subunit NirD [Teredinibacter franksiae]|jgi:assimilatory nitrite reductase (NAD(P)H) small subunit (EC 1.7.1.4)|uniref:nitrite reductase small subunit NirD n=1 Tax=Teredinibacter franksiae TaxID=2761453 RepID=UPI001624E983|nr:nitrite reductase small subunit NirD [Teredinibacter franksiae]